VNLILVATKLINKLKQQTPQLLPVLQPDDISACTAYNTERLVATYYYIVLYFFRNKYFVLTCEL